MKFKAIYFTVIILLFAWLVIFYKFSEIPKFLFFDEVEFARLALQLNKTRYTPYSELATGHSTLYYYIILASFKLFGLYNFSLRYPSALFGILSALLFYLSMQHIYKSFLFSMGLGVIFITSRWFFSFARFSFEATFLLFLELASIYFLLRFWKNKGKKFLIISAIFAGFAFHSYYPGRIFFMLPLFFLILYKFKKEAIIFFSTVIIVMLPLLSYLLNNQDLRLKEQFFLSDSKINFTKKATFLKENLIKTIFMFNVEGDKNGRHNYPGKPILNPIFGTFFIVGLFSIFLNLKNFYHQLFLFYFIISLVPTLFTYPAENPHMLRAYTAIPSTIYFIGQGILYIIPLFQENLKKKNIILMCILLLIASVVYELKTYFTYQNIIYQEEVHRVPGEIKSILKI